MRIDWTKYNESEAKEIADKFGKQTIQDMATNIREMGLLKSKKLLDSLRFSVRKDGIEVNRIQFAYEFYGRFQEKGANNAFGKNVSLKPSPWRNRAIDKNKEELDKEFNEFYAHLIMDELELASAKMKM